MANRKKHLKRQAARHSDQSTDTQSVAPAKLASADKPEVIKKAKSASKASPTEYTQLSSEETRIVWLELRHVLMTACVILLFFLVVWLVFHYTDIDDKIYSFFHLIPKSS